LIYKEIFPWAARSDLVATQEEKILSRNCNGSQGSLRRIVIDGEPAVTGVARKRFPAAEAVLDRLAESALQRQPPAFALEPALQLGQQRHCTGLPLGEPDVGGLAIDLGLNRIERADAAQRFFRNRRLGRIKYVEEVSPRMRHTLDVRDARRRTVPGRVDLQVACVSQPGRAI
jgi:hypothetical protein